jgi:hypothetical protein
MDRQGSFGREFHRDTNILSYIINILVLLLFRTAQIPNTINRAVMLKSMAMTVLHWRSAKNRFNF